MWFHKFASTKYFYQFATKMIPWLAALCIVTLIYGLIGGLYLAPPDYQQGDGFRIMYVHVPCAILSLAIYVFLAIAAFIGLVWKIKLANMAIKPAAVIGAWFTFLALVTGAIWGKPMWGTYWVWDARLTTELIQLFLYLGIIALHQAFNETEAADRACGILAILGVINVPIIHYSVYWWNTLHQGNSLDLFGNNLIAPVMLYPLIAMIIAFFSFFAIIFLFLIRTEILLRQMKTQWIKNL